MMIGTVLGLVTLCRAVPGGEEKHFVRVRCGERLLTALDPVGAQTGEQVLLTMGQPASRFAQELPVDTVVLGILKRESQANCG